MASTRLHEREQRVVEEPILSIGREEPGVSDLLRKQVPGGSVVPADGGHSQVESDREPHCRCDEQHPRQALAPIHTHFLRIGNQTWHFGIEIRVPHLNLRFVGSYVNSTAWPGAQLRADFTLRNVPLL
jgi:hypothetical protein